MRLLLSLAFVPALLSAQAGVQDTSIVFRPVYTKKECKKESRDLKAYDKAVREFRKSSSGANIDLKNASLEALQATMKKEYDELNARITARARKYKPVARNADSSATQDLPKAYNPTIKNQIPRVDRESVMSGKSETGILLLYSRILNKENRLIRQLSQMQEVTEATPASSFEEILRNAAEFRGLMKDEISLMSKEKGRKEK